ncbi:MAG: hypothetical protein HUU11_11845, partial [Anaerolineales bacterium]|nr:hypothetical protein [Anaerolineales bacterium]
MSSYPTSDSPQPVRVALPASVPYVTYAILGVTVFVYLLQIASVFLFGYPSTFSNI